MGFRVHWHPNTFLLKTCLAKVNTLTIKIKNVYITNNNILHKSCPINCKTHFIIYFQINNLQVPENEQYRMQFCELFLLMWVHNTYC
jgi:hypothetical protein